MAETHHLSQAAYDRLKAEYDELTTVGRVDIARKIEAARELGDLKENGDYHAAKDHQGQMEARIRQIGGMIENAEIVEGTDGDAVEPGCVVELRYEGDDDTDLYFFGSVEERGVEHDIISPGSPLGEALVGRKPGDKVDFTVAHRRQPHRRARQHPVSDPAAEPDAPAEALGTDAAAGRSARAAGTRDDLRPPPAGACRARRRCCSCTASG